MTDPSDKIGMIDLSDEVIQLITTGGGEDYTEIINALTSPDTGLTALRTALDPTMTESPYGENTTKTFIEKLVGLAESDTTHLSLDGLTLVVNAGTFGTLYFDPIGFGYDGTNVVTLCARTFATVYNWHSNASMVEWEASYLRNHLRTTFYNALPASIQNAIIPVKKSVGLSNSTSVTTNRETVWIPSATEVGYGYDSSAGDRYTNGEGQTYPAFTEQFMRIRLANAYSHTTNSSFSTNTAYNWWLRSPALSGANGMYVSNTGTTGSSTGITTVYGVVPCFCI